MIHLAQVSVSFHWARVRWTPPAWSRPGTVEFVAEVAELQSDPWSQVGAVSRAIALFICSQNGSWREVYSGEDTECLLRELSPETCYAVRLLTRLSGRPQEQPAVVSASSAETYFETGPALGS